MGSEYCLLNDSAFSFNREVCYLTFVKLEYLV